MVYNRVQTPVCPMNICEFRNYEDYAVQIVLVDMVLRIDMP